MLEAVQFDNKQERRAFGRSAVVGIEFAVVVVAALLGGYWLDDKFGTSPLWLFVGLALGFGTGLRILWKVVKANERDVE